MLTNKDRCDTYKLLLMKKLDGEISPEESRELTTHLESCSSCRDEFTAFKGLKEETQNMRKAILPEMAWDEYWGHLFNRLERGIGWILISIGMTILGTYGLYEFITTVLQDHNIPWFIRIALLALSLGGALLLVSVIREKLVIRKHDKYKDIQR